jgi:hypothetical protein
MQSSLFKYYVIRYVPDVMEDAGIDFAIVAASDSEPGRVALKQIPLLAPIVEFDSHADVTLLNAFLAELITNIQLDCQYLDRAIQWENCIRVLPPHEFVTSDLEGTLSLLAGAELGTGA